MMFLLANVASIHAQQWLEVKVGSGPAVFTFVAGFVLTSPAGMALSYSKCLLSV
jgi:hypothetical protein